MGAEVRYRTKGIRLIQDRQGKVCGAVVQGPDGFEEISANSGCWPAEASRPMLRCAPVTSGRVGS
jgi:hypothetical protein